MVELIPDSTHLWHLARLLGFLVAWKNPPREIAIIAHHWCSAISEKLRDLDRGRIALEGRLLPRPDLWYLKIRTADEYADLLLKALELGFRRSEPRNFGLVHTSHHHWMFDIVFSSDDDEVIADAVCAWVVDRHQTVGSSARHLSRRVERGTPFSPRLRRMVISVLNEGSGVAGSELDIARLLNHLDPNMDIDVRHQNNWRRLLADVIRSLTGRMALSPRNWRLLGDLAPARGPVPFFELYDMEMEVLRSLYDAEDWERLEEWMLLIWSCGLSSEVPMEDIEQVTLRLLQRRPSALQRFETLYKRDDCIQGGQLRQVCDRVRTEQLSSVSL